jgi:peroxiredoxin
MNAKKSVMLTAALAALLPLIAAATEPPAKEKSKGGDEPDAMEVLRQADKAAKALTAASYEAECLGEGDMAGRVAHVKGTVLVKERRRSLLGRIVGGVDRPQSMRIEAEMLKPGAKKGQKIKVATDGERVYRIDEENEVFTTGTVPGAESLLAPATRLFMLEYVHPTPFKDELNGKSAKYEGRKEIGGVECHVVFVVYANDSESRWYFGTQDYLPRRVDRLVKDDDQEGAVVLQVTKLNTSPQFGQDDFKLSRPKGYEKKEYLARETREVPLLKVGSPAPKWELKTPDGKTVALEDLRGKVVVLNFWATWCGPCKAAMAGVQKLHEQFKDRPVKVFGVNCWENESADPAKFMKDKECTYGLLLEADETAEAYRVSGIPTFYVIDQQGKILYANAGFTPEREKEIADIIDKALGDRAEEEP